MPTTPKLGLRYPNATDAPDGPGAFLNIATDLDNLQQDQNLTFPGTITNFAGYSSYARRVPGNVVVLSLSVFLASGFTVAGTPTIAATTYLPYNAGGSPTFVVSLYNGSAWGGYALCAVGIDGVIRLNYMSGPATGIFGTVTYRQ